MRTEYDENPIVVYGGDGSMLHAIRKQGNLGRPFYGVHHDKPGSVGFLMNRPLRDEESIEERIGHTQAITIHPLQLVWKGKAYHAVNEVTVLRASAQAVRLCIQLNGQTVLEGLYGDGLIVSTPTGSTAYNHSAGGVIIPIHAPLLALTPVCSITGWKGALIDHRDHITITLMDGYERPVNLCLDNEQVDVWQSGDDVASIRRDMDTSYRLLFDPDHYLDTRIRAYQFSTVF